MLNSTFLHQMSPLGSLVILHTYLIYFFFRIKMPLSSLIWLMMHGSQKSLALFLLKNLSKTILWAFEQKKVSFVDLNSFYYSLYLCCPLFVCYSWIQSNLVIRNLWSSKNCWLTPGWLWCTVTCIIVRRLLISVHKWQFPGMADTHEYWSQHDAHLVYLPIFHGLNLIIFS